MQREERKLVKVAAGPRRGRREERARPPHLDLFVSGSRITRHSFTSPNWLKYSRRPSCVVCQLSPPMNILQGSCGESGEARPGWLPSVSIRTSSPCEERRRTPGADERWKRGRTDRPCCPLPRPLSAGRGGSEGGGPGGHNLPGSSHPRRPAGRRAHKTRRWRRAALGPNAGSRARTAPEENGGGGNGAERNGTERRQRPGAPRALCPRPRRSAPALADKRPRALPHRGGLGRAALRRVLRVPRGEARLGPLEFAAAAPELPAAEEAPAAGGLKPAG